MKLPNHRSQRTPRFRSVCISRQWRGAAAAERWASFKVKTLQIAAGCILWIAQCVPTLASEGYVIQWGWNSGKAAPTPATLVASNATAISAGAFHSLALRSDGTVFGWGYDLSGGVLGSKVTDPRTPTNGLVKIDGETLSNVVSVLASREWSLALKRDGTVVTWGENYVPNALSNIIGIAVDEAHSWVLKGNGTVVGWFREPTPHYGLLTADSLSNVMTIAVGSTAQGGTRGVALKRDGTIATWGAETTTKEFTAPPAGLSNVVAVAAGPSHSLALKSDGTVVGWGWNKDGEATGTPTTNSPNNLDCISAGQVRVGGEFLTGVVSIAAGPGYSLALKKDGTVVAWGRMINAQYAVNIPEGLHDVVAIAAGWDFCLAITTNKEVAERFRR